VPDVAALYDVPLITNDPEIVAVPVTCIVLADTI
jgi:hypothetical protein